jgi:hypothetical protein
MLIDDDDHDRWMAKGKAKAKMVFKQDEFVRQPCK